MTKATKRFYIGDVARRSEFVDPEPQTFPVIAATHWYHMPHGPMMFAADTPYGGPKSRARTSGRADWEFTDKYDKAKPLSKYWWQRFRADQHYCNHCAHAWDAPGGGVR